MLIHVAYVRYIEVQFLFVWCDLIIRFCFFLCQTKVWTKKPNALQWIFLSCPDISLEDEMHYLSCNFLSSLTTPFYMLLLGSLSYCFVLMNL